MSKRRFKRRALYTLLLLLIIYELIIIMVTYGAVIGTYSGLIPRLWLRNGMSDYIPYNNTSSMKILLYMPGFVFVILRRNGQSFVRDKCAREPFDLYARQAVCFRVNVFQHKRSGPGRGPRGAAGLLETVLIERAPIIIIPLPRTHAHKCTHFVSVLEGNAAGSRGARDANVPGRPRRRGRNDTGGGRGSRKKNKKKYL